MVSAGCHTSMPLPVPLKRAASGRSYGLTLLHAAASGFVYRFAHGIGTCLQEDLRDGRVGMHGVSHIPDSALNSHVCSCFTDQVGGIVCDDLHAQNLSVLWLGDDPQDTFRLYLRSAPCR